MNRPWFQMYSRDWLDNKELRRCSPAARAVLADLMCLAHEGEIYGFLTDKVGALPIKYLASRCTITAGQFLKCLAELKANRRIEEDENSVLFIRRMVEDEALRLRRAAGGSKGGNPVLSVGKVGVKVNLTPNLNPEVEVGCDSRARMRADSGSGSSEVEDPSKANTSPRALLPRDGSIPVNGNHQFQDDIQSAWDWVISVFPGAINPEYDAQIFVSSVRTFEDIAFLRRNTPEWAKTKQWQGGFAPSLENYLRKRLFRATPPKSKAQASHEEFLNTPVGDL